MSVITQIQSKYRNVAKVHLPLLLYCISIAFISFLLITKIAPQAMVTWDEASHLESMMVLVHGIRTGDFTTYRYFLTQRPDKPPLHELLLAPILAITGFSVEAAHTAGIIWFILTCFLVYLLATRTGEKERVPHAGIFAGILTLTSPLFLYLSATALREGVGAAWSLIILYFCQENLFRITWKKRIWVGFLLFCLSMIKLEYGILLGAAIGITICIDWVVQKKTFREFIQTLSIFILPIFLGGLYSLPPWRANLIWETLKDPFDMVMFVRPTRLQILLFYPRALVYMYALDPLIGFTMVIAAIYAVIRYRAQFVRLLFIFSALFIVLGIWHESNMQERYMAPVVPSVMILAGLGIAAAIKDTVFRLPKFVPYLLCLVLLAVVGYRALPGLIRLPERIGAVASYTARSPIFLQRDFKQEQWYLYDPSAWPHDIPWWSVNSPKTLIEQTAKSVDLSKTVVLLGDSSAFSRPYQQLIFNLVKESGDYPHLPYTSFAILFEIHSTSPLYTSDYQHNSLWRDMQGAAEIAADGNYELYKTIPSPSLGVTSLIYAKR